MRRSEVLRLKWHVIDFERGTISVKQNITIINLGGKYQDIEKESAKTKSSLRTLPLVGSFKEYFMQVKEVQELNKKVAEIVTTISTMVMCSWIKWEKD